MDLSLLKKKLDGLQQKTSPKEKTDYSKIYWSPKVGKQQIRIVPSAFNQANPFTELKIYYGITNKVMISPTNFGEKDPIALFATKLRSEYNKENYVLAKKLDPKVRIFAPVIVRGEEDMGVRLWQFGKQVYEELISLAVDEEIGDYTDIVNGRDITVDTVGPESTGTPYNKSSVRVKLKTSPLGENKAQVESWLKEQPNPSDSFKKYTFEEMKSALEKWLSPGDEAEEGDIIDEKNDGFEDETTSNGLPWDEKDVPAAKPRPAFNYDLNISKAKQSKGDQFDSLFGEDA
jgi:hypothetical protein